MTSSSNTVLLYTTAEYGAANVFFAIAYELALAGVNVCLSSFAPFESRIARLQELVICHASRSGGPPAGSVIFHEYKGLTSYWDAMAKNGINAVTLPHPHGIASALESYTKIEVGAYPWDAEEHLAAIETAKKMIETIKPDVVVADPLHLPALDACQLVGQKFIVLFPNSIMDAALKVQPRFAALWKYPAMSSGFSFPLKWWQVPFNVFLHLQVLAHLMIPARTRKLTAMRRSLGITLSGGLDVCSGAKHICPALPETDYPFEVIPEEMVLCGPIVVPFDPLEESDPALMKWLDNGPTVMVNLGSHAISSDEYAREMAGAFRMVLDYHDRKGNGALQVLWKVKTSSDFRKTVDDIIGKDIKEGRVKVVGWVEAEPISILQHLNVVCTVHHGGANSYFEGIWSGLPHVVLPVWFDTYDYANRVEFFGIGLFGNKSCAPGVRAEEFGRALVRVTGDTEEVDGFRSTAKRLKGVCRAKGNGRKLASEAVLKEMQPRRWYSSSSDVKLLTPHE